MYIKQLYTGCLSEAAYYVESEGEAAIIDPLREVQPYLDLAQERDARIRYVMETHFHADFVSGHLDLSHKTGAPIVFGPNADTRFEAINARDGEIFSLGKLSIQVLYTPGHTPCSSCYLLFDEKGKAHALFTGDTLFVGDVGRPDLLDGVMSKEELAGMLFDSLNEKIKVLPDDVLVYPAHGAGSQCGKSMGSETWTTLGEQKRTNYALQCTNRDAFIEQVTEGLQPPPKYFPKDAQINRNGYAPIDEVMTNNLKSLDMATFKAEMQPDVVVLDTRQANDFANGFVPGAINIGLDGRFAVWVGTLLDIATPLLLVTDPGNEEEAVLRLARVGFEQVKGYLAGGMEGWDGPVDRIASVAAEQLVDKADYQVLDVRQYSEWCEGHLPQAQHVPLAEMPDNLQPLDKDLPYTIYCGGGYRSMTAASLMKRAGYNGLLNVTGGMQAIVAADLPLVQEAVVSS